MDFQHRFQLNQVKMCQILADAIVLGGGAVEAQALAPCREFLALNQSFPILPPFLKSLDEALGAGQPDEDLADLRQWLHAEAAATVLALADHFRVSLASVEAYSAFLNRLGLPSHDEWSELAALLKARLNLMRTGSRAGGEVLNLASGVETLRGPEISWLVRSFVEALAIPDPSAFAAAKGAFRTMDTRPAWANEAGTLALVALRDLNLHEKLALPASTALGAHEGWPSQMFHSLRALDKALLIKLARSRLVHPGARGEILTSLCQWKLVGNDSIRRVFNLLRSESPANWHLMKMFLGFRECEGAEPEALLTELQTWMASADKESFEFLAAVVRAGVLYERLGQAEEGFAFMAPFRESMKADVLTQAARLAELARLPEQAERGFLAAMRRYQSSPRTIGKVIGYLWRQDRHAEAASILAAKRDILPASFWSGELADEFIAAFSADDAVRSSQAVRAIATLIPQQMSGMTLGSLKSRLVREKRFGQAHATASFVLSRAGDPQALFLAADLMAKAQDSRKAMEWLAPRLQGMPADVALTYGYRTLSPEMLWSLPYKDEKIGEYGWLVRTLASHNPEQKERVRAHFASGKSVGQRLKAMFGLSSALSTDGDDFYRALGRHLNGFGTLRDVEPFLTDPKRMCEAAYFLGKLAEQRHRIRDAIRYFRLAVETGASRNGEFHWATSDLAGWASWGWALDRIEAYRKAHGDENPVAGPAE